MLNSESSKDNNNNPNEANPNSNREYSKKLIDIQQINFNYETQKTETDWNNDKMTNRFVTEPNEINEGNPLIHHRLNQVHFNTNITATTPNSSNWKTAKKQVNAFFFAKRVGSMFQANTNRVFKGMHIKEYKSIVPKISPTGVFKTMWDVLMAFTTLYYMFVISFRLAFSIHNWTWSIVDLILDFLITLDVALNFVTGIKKVVGINYNLNTIVVKYVNSYFIFDIISISPLWLYWEGFYILKCFRWIKISIISDLIQRLSSQFVRMRVLLNQFYIFILFSFFVHIMASMWVYLGLNGTDPSNPSWTTAADLDTTSSIYFSSLFFVVYTVTSVGYGNIIPADDIATFYTMFLMFVGYIFFALVQSKILIIISESELLSSYYEFKRRELDIWLLQREKSKLQGYMQQSENELMNMSNLIRTCSNIRDYFKYVDKYNMEVIANPEFLDKLPPVLYDKLSSIIFAHIIKRFNFFFGQISNAKCLWAICSNLVSKLFFKDSIIIKQGDRPDGIYFLLDGVVNILDENNQCILNLKQKTFFGDSFYINNQSNITYKAATEVKTFYIPEFILRDILKYYLEDEQKFKIIAKLRDEYIINIMNKNNIYNNDTLINHDDDDDHIDNYSQDINHNNHVDEEGNIIEDGHIDNKNGHNYGNDNNNNGIMIHGNANNDNDNNNGIMIHDDTNIEIDYDDDDKKQNIRILETKLDQSVDRFIHKFDNNQNNNFQKKKHNRQSAEYGSFTIISPEELKAIVIPDFHKKNSYNACTQTIIKIEDNEQHQDYHKLKVSNEHSIKNDSVNTFLPISIKLFIYIKLTIN